MSQQAAQPQPTAPDIRIVKGKTGWEADPDVFRVTKGSQPVIVLAGPNTHSLEGVWFKDLEHAWKFGAKKVPAFPSDANGRVVLHIKDVEPGEYDYGFRVDGVTVDPKIIIDPPPPPPPR